MAINFPASPNQGDIFEEGEDRFWIFNGTAWDSSAYPEEYSPTTYAGEESVTFPDGIIMKHGVINNVAGNSLNVITFGTAFPTAATSAQVTWYAAGDLGGSTGRNVPRVADLDATTLDIRNPDAISTYSIFWQVWGY